MAWWQVLLFPFSVFFDLITRLRNQLFDQALIKPIQFETNVIGIGNLSVGGTGKSPMVTYLIEYLSALGWQVSTLSRGYKRQTKGFRLATEKENARTLGDEPFMFYRRYKGKANVAVGEERILAIPELLFNYPETDVVILDDIFQHRTVQPNINILLTTYQRPYYDDYLLPSGRLRESRSGSARADMVMVTKCPLNLPESEQRAVREKINQYTTALVFFTGIEYDQPVPFFDEEQILKDQIILISGIANAQVFHRHVAENFSVKMAHQYGDHHTYSLLDIKGIVNELGENCSLVTTEKDAVKMMDFEELRSYSCFYIPIRVKFLKDESLFQNTIENAIKDYRQDLIN